MPINTELFLLDQLSEALTKKTFVKSISMPVVVRQIYIFIVEFKTTIAVFTVEAGVWSWSINSPKPTMGTLRTRDLTKLVEDFEGHLQLDEIKLLPKIKMLNLITEFINELPGPQLYLESEVDYIHPDRFAKKYDLLNVKNKDTKDIPHYPKD
jgi:hypothetical protein